MKKSISTRFKITKRGKVLHRVIAQDHFRAKKSSNKIRGKKNSRKAAHSIAKRMFKKPGTL